MKKAVALVLALTILSGLVPQGAIFAHDQNTQLPVSDLVIQAAESGPNLPVNSYRFSLFWNRPAPGRTLQQESATYNADDIRATNYRVEYVNKTRTQPNLPNDYLLDAGRPNPVIYTKPFQPGCLYEVRVIPYHIHYFFTTNSSGTIRTDRQIEPTGADLASERRAMFLTDLIVDGYSLNNEITVTWSNPVWRGTGGNVNVVDSYRVSYRVIDSNNNPGPEVVIPVALTHPNLREIGGRWEFTFPIPASNTGWSYDVKVVPLIGGTPVHAIRNPISVGGVMYDVACRNGEYWKETPITVSPTLSYRVDGVDAIRLIWTSLRGVPGSNMIDRLDIEEWDVDSTYDDLYNDPQLLKRLGIIGRIAGSNTNVLGITSYRDELDDMNVPKAYRLAIYFAGESEARVRTNLVIYVPDLIDFEPYSPTVKKFDVDNEDVPSLLLWWLAFARQPYNAEEAAEIDPRFGKYIDKNVEYDVYVTDVYENLDILYNDSVPLFRSVTGLTADKEGSDPDPIYKLRSSITEYQALTATGVVTKKLEYNKSYYVMIVARRVPFGTQSTKAYGDFYLPYPGSLPVRPAMIAAPPLVACDPPQIGRDFITIEWDLKYIEMYDPKTDDWYAVAGPSAAGPVFGRSAMDLSGKESILNNRVDPGRTWIPDYNSENPSAADLANFNAARDILAAQLNMSAGDVELRIIDLSKASYEIHTVEYTHMMAQGGYETYRRNNLDETFIPASANNWSPLSGPLGEGSKRGMVSYVVRSFNAPGSGALKENTAYVIYLRPYVNDAGVKVAYLPNYVMATTLESKPELDVKPVAPALEPVSETDDTLTVRWKMLRNQDNIPYEYDLQYTERLTNGGTVWYALNWDFIKDDVLIRTVGSDEYMYYTITKLFPDTLYNIRIMARYPTASKQQSEWSNPIEMRTLDITAPNPPQGLGLAGRDHISEYNRLNGTDYSPSEQNALNISWMRDGLDDKPAAGAGNATGGSAELLPLDEIKDFLYMVRFEGLLPNRSYYIRAKTIKTVSRSGPGAPSDTAYSYVVQVAQTDEFLDCIEFVIPPVARQGDISETNVKQKESGWSTAIRLVTSRTDEEYDGDVNPDHYPLPDRDFEYVFDPLTHTLTYRFRSNRVDSSGANDNNVDQRFISRLVQERVFVFKVDLTGMRDNRDVVNRSVVIPYSIFKAFDERKITLEISTPDAVLTVPPGSLNTQQIRALPGFGAGSDIKINISDDRSDLPALSNGDHYASKPVKLSVQAILPNRTVNLEQFAKPLKITQPLDITVATNDRNVGQYFSTRNTGGWERLNFKRDPLENTLSSETLRAGAFSGIAKPAAPYSGPADQTRDAMIRVSSKINVTGMNAYNPNAAAGASAFNNLVAAVALNRKTAAVDMATTAADVSALTKAKLYVQNPTREAAVSALVTLHELKTKRVINNPSSTVATTPVSGIRGAAPAYQRSLLKAADIGLIDETFRPGGAITMGELMTMLDIIMLDAGI